MAGQVIHVPLWAVLDTQHKPQTMITWFAIHAWCVRHNTQCVPGAMLWTDRRWEREAQLSIAAVIDCVKRGFLVPVMDDIVPRSFTETSKDRQVK